MKYQLELQNISKSYGALKANENISFGIRPASVHALLGENGAGKSTLVKLIYGSLQPDSGSMQWCGQNYKPNNPFEARENGVSMVFQQFSLFESLTVAENIALGLDNTNLDNELVQIIIKHSKQYGLDINPNQTVGDLSVGARQQIGRAHV
jgi:simple sugar transport system ATP-binding protein